jgi:hypothetical protein
MFRIRSVPLNVVSVEPNAALARTGQVVSGATKSRGASCWGVATGKENAAAALGAATTAPRAAPAPKRDKL